MTRRTDRLETASRAVRISAEKLVVASRTTIEVVMTFANHIGPPAGSEGCPPSGGSWGASPTVRSLPHGHTVSPAMSAEPQVPREVPRYLARVGSEKSRTPRSPPPL